MMTTLKVYSSSCKAIVIIMVSGRDDVWKKWSLRHVWRIARVFKAAPFLTNKKHNLSYVSFKLKKKSIDCLECILFCFVIKICWHKGKTESLFISFIFPCSISISSHDRMSCWFITILSKSYFVFFQFNICKNPSK